MHSSSMRQEGAAGLSGDCYQKEKSERMPMRRAKRLFDIAIAAALLVPAVPVMLAAAFAIRLSSAGPVLFSQPRVGWNERSFRCLKLRTMRAGTPSLPTHEAPKNSLTPVGKFLRGSKVDELPQLWNVLRGEMSLVGPRPCLPTQDVLIENRRRLAVFSMPPGITGLAQVRGIDMSDPVLCAEADGEYVRCASLGLDAKILLRTVIPGWAVS